MSSRRSFLGAAAAALSLPATGVGEGDPDGSTPGDAEPDHGSSRPRTVSSAPLAARMDLGDDDGSIEVGSVQFTRPDTITYEAEVVLSSTPLRLAFASDRTSARQLRDTLRGDRADGYVKGTVELWADAAPMAEGSVSVLGDRLKVETEGIELVAQLDEETRADVADGLTAALEDPATVEE